MPNNVNENSRGPLISLSKAFDSELLVKNIPVGIPFTVFCEFFKQTGIEGRKLLDFQ